MNFLKHRQQTPSHVLPIPDGLHELMSDITREVVRCQPTMDCIYKFIADYLEAMIATREKSKIAIGIIEEAILNTDEVYTEFLKFNIPKDRTENFVGVLENTFSRFVEHKRRMNQDPRYITFQADDMLDELMRKCDMTKVEILRSRPAIQWAYKKFVQTYIAAIEGTFDVTDLYERTDKLVISCKEFHELEKSAVTIQKTYRGFQVRKQKLKPVKSVEKIIKDKNIDPVEKSAVTIQKHYRGYQVRKKVQPKTGLKNVDSLEKFKVLKPMYSTSFIKTIKTQEYARENEDLTRAAIKIQATYKGFNTRKKLKGPTSPAE